MKFVAFFRNVNLGRPKSPTKAQLEAAFTRAGAKAVQSFLTNGTAVFAVATEQMARQVVARTCQELESVCGLEEPAYICSLRHLADLVAANPFAGVAMVGVYQCCVSFMPADALLKLQAPLRSPRRDVEVLRVTSEAALSVTRNVGGRPGKRDGISGTGPFCPGDHQKLEHGRSARREACLSNPMLPQWVPIRSRLRSVITPRTALEYGGLTRAK